MASKKKNEIEFKVQKQTITTTGIVSQVPNFYTIYKTNSGKFFIKIFDNQNKEDNIENSSQELKIQNSVLTNGIKIIDQKEVDNKVVFLIESFFCTLAVDQSFQISTLYELKKMLKHIFVQIKILVRKQKFVFVDLSNIVLNKSYNFELFNVQTNPNTVRYNFQYLPPETQFIGQFNLFTIVWNIGIIILQLRLGQKKIKIDYDNGKIDFGSQEQSRFSKRQDEYIMKIVQKCLQFEPQDRILYNDLQSLIFQQDQFRDMFISNPYKYIEKFKDFFVKFGNLKCREILIAEDLQSQQNKNKKQRLAKMVDNLLNPKNEFNMFYVLEIISACTKDNKKYNIVLKSVLKKVQSIKVQSQYIFIFKILLFLMPFIYMSPNQIHLTYTKNDKKNSYLDQILSAISQKVENKNDLLFLLAIILQEKCNFIFRCQLFLDNNFGITKFNFVNNWDKLCKIKFIKDLVNLLQLDVGFLLLIKTQTQNHFLQKLQDFVMQEINSIIKLAINVLCLLYYLDTYHWSKELYKIIEEIIMILENDKLIMNQFLIQHFIDEKRKKSLIIQQDLYEQFQSFIKQIQKYKKLNFQSFIQNYVNFVVEMQNGLQEENQNIHFDLQEDLLLQQQMDWYRYKDSRDFISIDLYSIIVQKQKLSDQIELFLLKNNMMQQRRKTEDSIYYSQSEGFLNQIVKKNNGQKDTQKQPAKDNDKQQNDLQKQIKHQQVSIKDEDFVAENIDILSQDKQRSMQNNVGVSNDQKVYQQETLIPQSQKSGISNNSQNSKSKETVKIQSEKQMQEYQEKTSEDSQIRQTKQNEISNLKEQQTNIIQQSKTEIIEKVPFYEQKQEKQQISQLKSEIKQETLQTNSRKQDKIQKSNLEIKQEKYQPKTEKSQQNFTSNNIQQSIVKENTYKKQISQINVKKSQEKSIKKSQEKSIKQKESDMRIYESRTTTRNEIEMIGAYLTIQPQSKNVQNIIQNLQQEKKIQQSKSTQTIKQKIEEKNPSIQYKIQNQSEKDIKDLDIGQLMVKFVESQIQLSAAQQLIDYAEIEFIKLIHNGSSSQIFLGKYRFVDVAIKRLKPPEAEGDLKFLKEFQNELQLQIQIPHHPNLLNMIGVCYHFQNFFIITEYCNGGNLYDVMFEIDLSMFFKKYIKNKNQFRCCQSYILFTLLG